jgi:FHA domain
MGVVSRAIGYFRQRFRRGPLERARQVEALGRLESATALYLQAGARDEAARLLTLRADAAREPAERLALLGRARECASGDARIELAVRRARLALDLAEQRTRQLLPSELGALGAELEQLDQPELAARAFALAGDVDAEARSLISAGDVERLEAVLDAEQQRQEDKRDRAALLERLGDLDRAGRRREALALTRDAPNEVQVEEAFAALRRSIELKCCRRDPVRLELDGRRLEVAFGDTLRIGRSDVNLVVASPAVSRAHLEVRRGANGPEAVDLGSHNGTWLSGARLGAPLEITPGLELSLGGEVRVVFEPWRDGTCCTLGDRTVCAPLGPLVLGGWSVTRAADGLLELGAAEGTPLVLNGLSVAAPIQLCREDVLSETLGGAVRLKVLG